jgi:hypothetical protein
MLRKGLEEAEIEDEEDSMESRPPAAAPTVPAAEEKKDTPEQGAESEGVSEEQKDKQ